MWYAFHYVDILMGLCRCSRLCGNFVFLSLNRNCTYIFSIITQVIIEILALSLAVYNHLRRGDYSGMANFQNNRLGLCQCA